MNKEQHPPPPPDPPVVRREANISVSGDIAEVIYLPQDSSFGSEVRLTTFCTPLPRSFESAGDIRTWLSVNGWQFSPGSRYSQLPGFFFPTEMCPDMIVRCDCFRVDGRKQMLLKPRHSKINGLT